MLAFAGCLTAQAPSASNRPPSEEWRERMREVLSNLQRSDRQLGEYGYDRFSHRREFESDGSIKSERKILARRAYFEADDLWLTRQIERNGQPVAEAELQSNLDGARKRMAEIQAMPADERAKLEAASRQRQQEENSWLKEFPEALDYRKVGEETIDGRTAIVLECSPRPGYKATNLRARVFSRIRGKIWIDQADSQLVRADAEVFETVNIGWGVLGKVHKGTRFHIERRKLPDGAWLPENQTIRFAVRVMLVKSMIQEETTRYSAYLNKSQLLARQTAPAGGAQSRAAGTK